MLQDAEESVQENLETHRSGLGPVEHQAGDVEHDVGLHDLHLHPEVVGVLVAELVKRCNDKTGWGRHEAADSMNGRAGERSESDDLRKFKWGGFR